MLSHAKLLKSFWGQDVKTTNDIINLSPAGPLDGDVREEVWSGKKAAYNHLKVFGCRTFVHIPKEERTKLDSKTKECIYLGSPRDEFGYRLWYPISKMIIRSRDVVFFEEQTIEDMKPEKTSPSMRRKSDDNVPCTTHENLGEDGNGNTDETRAGGDHAPSSTTNEENTNETHSEDPPLRRYVRE